MARLLLVEDAPLIRQIVSESLRDAGHVVVEARHGVEALEVVHEGVPFDLVITDLNMPRKNGLSLLRELRAMQAFREVPIVIHTSESSRTLQREGAEAGATAWVVKPFKLQTLCELVQMLLDKKV